MQVRVVSKEDQQIEMELKYSKSYIRDFVKKDLLSTEEVRDKISMCLKMIYEWTQKEDHYIKKQERIREITEQQYEDIIIDVLTLTAVELRNQAITGVAGRCIHTLKGMDYLMAVKTVAEVCSFMCEADLLDIAPAHVSNVKIKGEGVISVRPVYALDEQTSKRIEQTMHIPPMISKPDVIRKNSDCGYYTLNKHVILKRYNQHDERISLDAINKFNSNCLSIDIDFLKACEETLKPSKRNKKGELTKQIREQYEQYKNQSIHVFLDIINKGNKFYLTHHFDSVGRTYARGYHLSTQSKEYNKAMINFSESLPIDIPQGSEY